MRTILGIFMVICLAASTSACGGKCNKKQAEKDITKCTSMTDQAAAMACMEKVQKKYKDCK